MRKAITKIKKFKKNTTNIKKENIKTVKERYFQLRESLTGGRSSLLIGRRGDEEGSRS